MEFEGYAWHNPSELQTAPPFSDLYGWKEEDRHQQNILKSIFASMSEDGFQKHSPLIGWRQRNIIIDGETRRRAAIEARIDVLVRWMDFDDEYAALTFALAQQANRRNIQADDVGFRRARRALESARGKRAVGRPLSVALQPAEIALQNAISQTPQSDEQISKHEIATTLGYKSNTKVDDDRLVETHGGPELNRQVEEGKLTISKAAKKVRADRKAAKEAVEPVFTPSLKPESATDLAETEVKPDSNAIPQEAPARETAVTTKEIDKLVYDWISPKLGEIKAGLVALVGPPNLARVPPLYRAVWEMVNISSPPTWPPCSRCKGQDSAACRKCFGCGYQLPSL